MSMPKEAGSRKTKEKKMVRRALPKSLDDLPPDSTKNSFTKRIKVEGSKSNPSSMSCFGVSDGQSRTHLIQVVDDMNYRDMQRLDRRIRVPQSTSGSNPPSSNTPRSPGIHSSSNTARQKPSHNISSRASHGSGGIQGVPSSTSYPYLPDPPYLYDNFQGVSSHTLSADGAPYTHQLAIHEAQATHHGEGVRGLPFDAYQTPSSYRGPGSSAMMMEDNIKIGSNPGCPQQPPACGLPNYSISYAVPFTGSSYPTEVTSHGMELTSHPQMSESDLMLVNQPEDDSTLVDHSIYFSITQNLHEQPQILYRRPSYHPTPSLSPAIYRSPDYFSNGDPIQEFQYGGTQQYHNHEAQRFY